MDAKSGDTYALITDLWRCLAFEAFRRRIATKTNVETVCTKTLDKTVKQRKHKQMIKCVQN